MLTFLDGLVPGHRTATPCDRRLGPSGGKPAAIAKYSAVPPTKKLCLIVILALFTAGLAAVSQTSQPPPKQKSKPKPAKKELKRTDIDPTMVGYIDDSSVHSQVRLRFDAGFNDPRPDRAEYFYAGSCCPAPPNQAIQRTLNFQQLYMSGEYAPIKRFSIFTTIPYRWIQPIYIPAPNTVQPI